MEYNYVIAYEVDDFDIIYYMLSLHILGCGLAGILQFILKCMLKSFQIITCNLLLIYVRLLLSTMKTNCSDSEDT